jgi:formiminotetrahydrofolate cyclodeaminase
MAAPSDSFSLDEPLTRFVEDIAERTPTPGGGSVAAVIVGMAAALVEMGARFSDDWPEANGIVAQAAALRARVIPLAQADAEAYADALAALRLPKDQDPERRDFELGRALSRAADVPLEIAEVAADVAELAARVVELGNPNLRGDAATGAALAAAGARAAANLVTINLGMTANDARLERARRLVDASSAATARALAAST